MTQITLPNTNITGANLWSQVEGNDAAIRNVVNGQLDNSNIASAAGITGDKLADNSITQAKMVGGGIALVTATNASDVISSNNAEATVATTASLSSGTYLLLFAGTVQIPETVTTCYVRLKVGSTTVQTYQGMSGSSWGSTNNTHRFPISLSGSTVVSSSVTASVTIAAPLTGFGSAILEGSRLIALKVL